MVLVECSYIDVIIYYFVGSEFSESEIDCGF